MAKKKLSNKLATVLHDGAGAVGTFDPNEVLSYVMENLTQSEYDIAKGFLTWVYDNDKTFGWNIKEVYQEYILTS